MSDMKELLQSMKAEKDALLVERDKGVTGDASILHEFNFRRLNREMNLLCNEYEGLVSTNVTIEEKLSQLETGPPSPDNRRFHTKNEMRNYLENNPELTVQGYDRVLTDFGVHLKLARRMGWISNTPDGAAAACPLPSGTLSSTSPLVKRRKLSLNKESSYENKLPEQNSFFL